MTMTQSGVAVRSSAASDHAAMSAVLSRAFYADPVFEWAFPNPARRRDVLPAFFDAYVWAYGKHEESYVVGAPTGVALWVPAGSPLVRDEEAEEFDARIATACPDDLERLEIINEIFAQHHPHEPHWYLQLLGTVPEAQGQGYGSALLRDMLQRLDHEQASAFHEATSEDNRRLYERHGYEAYGEIVLPDGPTLYKMWRTPR